MPLILPCLREVHRLVIRLSNPVAVTKGAQVASESSLGVLVKPFFCTGIFS